MDKSDSEKAIFLDELRHWIIRPDQLGDAAVEHEKVLNIVLKSGFRYEAVLAIGFGRSGDTRFLEVRRRGDSEYPTGLKLYTLIQIAEIATIEVWKQ